MKETFVLSKAFCCPGFQNAIEAAGQRGIAILAKKTSLGIMFVLQSRGIAFEDVGKIQPMPGATDLKINVACDTGLQYCPWCGKRLEKLLEASSEVFTELAEKHKKFYSGP